MEIDLYKYICSDCGLLLDISLKEDTLNKKIVCPCLKSNFEKSATQAVLEYNEKIKSKRELEKAIRSLSETMAKCARNFMKKEWDKTHPKDKKFYKKEEVKCELCEGKGFFGFKDYKCMCYDCKGKGIKTKYVEVKND